MRLFRPIFPAACLYPEAVFRIKTPLKLLCLTFDDGPDPESTPVLISILRKYKIKAVFFCSGNKALENPALMELIKSEGHITGNHGYSHLNGWKTSNKEYIADIEKASALNSSNLFRPPFGHLTYRQYRLIRRDFRIFFWDIMPYDFDRKFGSRASLEILKRKLRKGSVIVLHDTWKSTANSFIDEFIRFTLLKGYEFVVPDLNPENGGISWK